MLVLEILSQMFHLQHSHQPFGFFRAESLGSRITTALMSLAVLKAKSRLSCFCVHLLTTTVSTGNPGQWL